MTSMPSNASSSRLLRMSSRVTIGGSPQEHFTPDGSAVTPDHVEMRYVFDCGGNLWTQIEYPGEVGLPAGPAER